MIKAIRIEKLFKRFENESDYALEDINAHLYEHQITGLVGPDGAGKTTLIRIMSGLLKPTQGQITLFDQPITEDALHLIGYMPQKFGLYEDLTVMENMELYAKLNGVRRSDKQAVFKKMLDFTRLSPFTTRLAKYLSGGMKQKLGLACAMMGTPQVLILDEPTVGVDPISRKELWQMCTALKQQGATILWSTSYLDEAEQCDRALLLYEGKLQFIGKPDEFSAKVAGKVFSWTPDTDNIRDSLSNVLQDPNVMDAVIQGKDIRIVYKDESKKDPTLQLKALPPRFEDAFVYSLEGQFTRKSVLTEHLPQKSKTSRPPIEAVHLTKQFGDFTAASDINFRVQQGEIFGLLGPNGAGKSTTFKMLCGLLQPTQGQALVSGLSLATASSDARAKIGYMAQKFSLYGDLSVQENLSFFAGAYGLKAKERNQATQQMLSIFDLKHYQNKNAGTLPLGFKQRLALSCAIMHNPDVLFLDEPTSGVDPLTRREFWTHINSLVHKGITIMITTHFMDEAEYCDRIALIYRGHCIASDTPHALKKMATSKELPNPTLEDAFISLIQKSRHEENATS